MKRAFFLLVVLCLAVIAPLVRAQEAKQSEREAMYRRYLDFPSLVKGGRVEPHWMADGNSFWYAEGAPDNTVIWKVDPVGNTKEPLFDTARLRKVLTPLLEHEPPHRGLPFDTFTFEGEGEKAIKCTVEDKQFILQLDTYAITRAPAVSEQEKNRLTAGRGPPIAPGWPAPREVLSPDGQWFAGIEDHNLYLRSTCDGRCVQLTSDGKKDDEWGQWGWWIGNAWSPNSLKLAVLKNPQTELFIIDIRTKRKVRVGTREEPDQEIRILGWRPDGSEVLFRRGSRLRHWLRECQVELIAANANTGSTRVILSERRDTYVHAWWSNTYFTLLPDGKRFVWMSQRHGGAHLDLYNMDGTPIRRLIEGALRVRVVGVDAKAGWVYFTALGLKPQIHDSHLYRVNLDGEALTQLTEASGEHEIVFAPSKKFFLDTHATPSRLPRVELRRADGALLRTLSKAKIEALRKLNWTPPEPFVVKAADGKTDLRGVLYKPYAFDLKKRYPVIGVIFGSGGDRWLPRAFIFSGPEAFGAQAMAQLGFIVFVVEVRFDLRNEVADHVAALRQLAEERPYMDLSRVGIIGWTMGGYMVIRAMLEAPDVYHVGVACTPITDISEHFENEVLSGPRHENKGAYEYVSNLRLAGNLKGKLLLVHGTSDRLVPVFHTMKMVDALQRAGKSCDLILLPDQGHMSLEIYEGDHVFRYFQEHLKP